MAARLGQSLLAGDDFFRALVDALPAAIYTTDNAVVSLTTMRPPLNFGAIAPTWGEANGADRGSCSGRTAWRWQHSECPMAVAVKERRAVRGTEAIAERPDGTRIPFIPFPTPIYDPQGQFIGAVNLLVEIGDRKRSEDAMQRLASIVESSDDAIVGKNLDGIITSWNKGAERIFGYLAEEMVGQPIKTLIPPEYHDEEDAIIDRIKRGQRVEHYETVRQRKHGSRIEVSLTVSPIKDSQGKIVGASKIARDISDAQERRGANCLACARGRAPHKECACDRAGCRAADTRRVPAKNSERRSKGEFRRSRTSTRFLWSRDGAAPTCGI